MAKKAETDFPANDENPKAPRTEAPPPEPIEGRGFTVRVCCKPGVYTNLDAPNLDAAIALAEEISAKPFVYPIPGSNKTIVYPVHMIDRVEISPK